MTLERKSSFRVEQAGESRSPSPLRPYFRRFRRTRALFCLLIVLLYFVLQASFRIHDALLKSSEPDFSGLAPANFSWAEYAPDHPIRTQLPNGDLDHRYTFVRKLGAGFEGRTAIFRDVETSAEVVVKTFDINSRSSMPQQLRKVFFDVTNYWPSEIPATLLLAGRKLNSETRQPQEYLNSAEAEYLPAIDYFLTTSRHHLHRSHSFHLVTPYVPLGTLASLGKHIQSPAADIPRTTSDLEQFLRPSLSHLLSATARLHARGYCHNDIKPSNILAASPTHWLLGDLGAVREATHAYYRTKVWRRKNQWRDCRHNDIRRLLKSYLELLRDASTDSAAWDEHFYDGKDRWASMYWDYLKNPVYAEELLESLGSHADTHGTVNDTAPLPQDASANPHPPPSLLQSPMRNPRLASLAPDERRKILAIAVRNELQCTSLRYGWRDWWTAGAWRPYLLLEHNEGYEVGEIG